MSEAICEVTPHELPHPCPTMWLSPLQAVVRAIELWNCLLLYFPLQKWNTKGSRGSRVNKKSNDWTFCIFVLSFILSKINNLNLLYQNNRPKAHTIQESVNQLYKAILWYFCFPDYAMRTSIREIDLAHSVIHAPSPPQKKKSFYGHFKQMILLTVQFRGRVFLIAT